MYTNKHDPYTGGSTLARDAFIYSARICGNTQKSVAAAVNLSVARVRRLEVRFQVWFVQKSYYPEQEWTAEQQYYETAMHGGEQ